MDTVEPLRAEKTNSLPFFYLREYLFPSGCGGCEKPLLNPKDAWYGLCEDCRDFFSAEFAQKNRCANCGKAMISEKDTCLDCRERNPGGTGVYSEYVEKLRGLFPYTGKYKAVLGAYKFGKSPGVGNFFALCLNAAIKDLVPNEAEDIAWVPVPPRHGKIRRQGWDQIGYLAGVLAARHRQFPVNRCLKRLPSKIQKELNREERGSNLKGRILCVKKPPKTAVVFDDIITTGATLNACASALLEGGAAKVYGVCLFYD